MTAILGAKLVVLSPGAHRAQLCALATYRRRGRLPKGVKRVVRYYQNAPGFVVLPRGVLPRVREIAPCQVVDKRLALPPVNFRWRSTLGEWQQAPARELARAGGGLLVGVPAAGKTRCAMAIVAAWRQPCLWLVTTKRLARQAQAAARAYYDLPRSAVGYIGQGTRDDFGTHFTVGMVQSLAKWTARDWRRYKLAERFGAVVFDEAHHAPSRTAAAIVSALPSRYRLALTATPDRADGLGQMLLDLMGGTVAHIERAKLIAAGRIHMPRVRVVPTGFHHGGGRWAELQAARSQDVKRNLLVCALAAQEHRAGNRVLILTDLRDHAKLLAKALTARYHVPAIAIDGQSQDALVDRGLAAVERGKAVLVATKLLNEGVDVPAVDRLILAATGRGVAFTEKRGGESRAIYSTALQQQIGRIMRAASGKTGGIVYDLADAGVVALAKQARQRLRAYRALGMEVTR